MRYIRMNSIKGAYELQKKNSRAEQETWKKRTLDSQPMIHAFTVLLWSTIGRIHNLQALKSRHIGSRLSEANNKWWNKCQVTCIDRHTCIDKSESKACIENRIVSVHIRTWIKHQVMRYTYATKQVVRA